MLKYFFTFSIFLLLFTRSLFPMDANFELKQEQEFGRELVNSLVKSISQSEYDGMVRSLDAAHGKKILKLSVIFWEEAVSDKQAIIKYLKLEGIKFLKKRGKKRVTQLDIVSKDTPVFFSKEVIEQISSRLREKAGYTSEVWGKVTSNADDLIKIKILQQIFKNLIFTQGLGKTFSDFDKCINLGSYALLFQGVLPNIKFEFKNANDKLIDRQKRLHRKITFLENGLYDSQEHCFSDTTVDISALLNKIQKAPKDFQSWSKLQALSQLLNDYIKAYLRASTSFTSLRQAISEYVKYSEAIKEIFYGIDEKHLYNFACFDYTRESIFQQEQKIFLQKVLEEDLERVNSNVDFLKEISSIVDIYLSEFSFDETNDLQNFPTQDDNYTSECKKSAQKQIAADLLREEKKRLRPGARVTSTCNINVNDTSKHASDSEIELQLFDIEKDENLQFKAKRLYENAPIYIGSQLTHDLESDKKLAAFLKTSERMKIIKQDSLGQNGIKIYGLDLLIAKNKKFPGEHLIFIAHPIDKDHKSYVFLPFKIAAHRYYDSLLSDAGALERVIENARRRVIITRPQDAL